MSKWHPHTLGQLQKGGCGSGGGVLLGGVLLDEALGGSLDHDEALGGALDHDKALVGFLDPDEGCCGHHDTLLPLLEVFMASRLCCPVPHRGQGLNMAPFCNLACKVVGRLF